MSTINQMAITFVNNFASMTADHTIEMMAEEPEEYTSFKQVESILSNTIRDNQELFEDHINELVTAIWNEYNRTKIKTVNVSFDSEGFSNADWKIDRT